MKHGKANEIQLVITIALKKELPLTWLRERHIEIHTLQALNSGAMTNGSSESRGILILITGPGLSASRESALWILRNLQPLFVINIGTCGILNKDLPTGQWIRPAAVTNSEGKNIALDMRLPIPDPGNIINANTLISLEHACKNEGDGIYDAADMECHAQAEVFKDMETTFHCLKFGTDYADNNTDADFKQNLTLFTNALKDLLSFLPQDQYSPAISVVIPVYNREDLVIRALESVLAQSLTPSEIIVVDDGSTDNTRSVLQDYTDRITLLHSETNSGASAARNMGIAHAKTEWIACLDSDDAWEKDKLKYQTAYLKKYPFYDIIQSDEKWIRNSIRVNPCKHHIKPFGWIWDVSLLRCVISPSGVMLRKSLLKQYNGFDETYPTCEDYDLWIKITRHHPVGLEPSLSIVKYRGHEDELSGKYSALDSFRSRSLEALLQNETNPLCRAKIIAILSQKLQILMSGAEKRNNIEGALGYKKRFTLISQL
ncbi:glycosyltransferase [bacterium]|nr:glycosyltransferase [bacterium]